MRPFYDAEQNALDPFVLVVEGSIPNELINGEGHWSGLGVNPDTGQPITTNEWVDRLAPKAAAVIAVGTCATYGGIPAMKNNPTGAMGLPDFLGWDWRSRSGLPIVCIPGCPAQPDNITETLLYLLDAPRRHVAAAGPRRACCDRDGCSGGRRERGAAAPGSPSRASSPPSTDPTRAAWSSSAARVRSRAATYPPAAGSAGSAAARTLGGSASRARCRRSPTATCRSWTPTVGEHRRELPALHLRPRVPLLPRAQPAEALRAGARLAPPAGRADERLHPDVVSDVQETPHQTAYRRLSGHARGDSSLGRRSRSIRCGLGSTQRYRRVAARLLGRDTLVAGSERKFSALAGGGSGRDRDRRLARAHQARSTHRRSDCSAGGGRRSSASPSVS